MRTLGRMAIWFVMMLNALMGLGQGTAQASEESELQSVKQQLDTEAVARSSDKHAETLAKQFKVEVGTVNQLRVSKHWCSMSGWANSSIV